MSTNSVRTKADPRAVFEVLDDACAYPRWVVGTRRVRSVDPGWPAVGTRFHHAVGTAVGELHDSSMVLQRDAPHHLSLEVRFRPAGVAHVDLDVAGDEHGSVITLTERPLAGPVSYLPKFVREPLLSLRNAISLQRLRHAVDARRERQWVRR